MFVACCFIFTVDVPKAATQLVETGLTDSEKELYFHANIHYERDIIAPWPLCLRKCVSQAADSKRQQHANNVSSTSTSTSTDPIVISDSDSDCEPCDDVKPPHGNNLFFFFLGLLVLLKHIFVSI